MESKNIVDEYLDKKIKEAEEQSRLEKEKPNVPKRRGFFKGFVSCIFCCVISVFKWIVLGLVFIIIDIYSAIERLFSGSRMNIGAKSQKVCNNTVRTDTTTRTASSKVRVGIQQGHLELVLDMVMKFLDAYATAVNDEWYLFYISQETKCTEYSDRYYTYDGYLKFEVSVGTWWNGMLKSPEVEDYMKTIFEFDSEHNKFTYAGISTGSSTCCAFPRDQVNKILQGYLDEYEAKHPGVRFERDSWGASIAHRST